MGKSIIFGFRVYDKSEDSRIYSYHLLESPSLNTIALVTFELLHRPISENNIDYKGRVLLAANNNWRQHWKHTVWRTMPTWAVSPTLSLHIPSPANLFIKSFCLQSFWIVVLKSPALLWLWLSISWMTPQGRSGKEKGKQIECQVSFSPPWRSFQWSRLTLPSPLLGPIAGNALNKMTARRNLSQLLFSKTLVLLPSTPKPKNSLALPATR